MFPSSKYIILIPLFLSLNQTRRLFDLRSRLSCYQTWQCLSCHECCSLCFTKVCIQCQKLDTVFIFVNQFGPTPFNHQWCKIFSEISSVVIESDAGCMLRIFLVFTRPTNSTVLCWFHIFSWIHFSHLDSKRLSWSAVLNSLIMESFSCGLEKKTVVFPALFNPCYLWSNYSEWFANSSHELCSTVVVTRKWWLVLSLVYPLQTNTIKPPSAFLTRFVAPSHWNEMEKKITGTEKSLWLHTSNNWVTRQNCEVYQWNDQIFSVPSSCWVRGGLGVFVGSWPVWAGLNNTSR